MPKLTKGGPTKKQRQRMKREQGALRMLRMSIELHVRLDYAKIPKVAAALSRARLGIRTSLFSRGFLTVEELESLAKEEAITAAAQRLSEQLRRTPTGKHRKRA